jgi:chromosome segregation ATPase
MATFHELQTQQRALLDDLDELEEATDALAERLRGLVETDTDECTDHQEQLAWLQRQRAGLLVVLSETERALLMFDASANAYD